MAPKWACYSRLNSEFNRGGGFCRATGCGAGASAIQIARGMGASAVIAVDVCDDKLAMMTKLGATHVVNAAKVDTVEAVREITGGRGMCGAKRGRGTSASLQRTPDSHSSRFKS